MMDELVHHPNSICELILKKCHPKSNHIEIEYRLALSIIFGVVQNLSLVLATCRQLT